MSLRVIHVRCSDTGSWMVHPEGDEEPASVHGTETEAEQAARRHAEECGGGPVVIHDRYARTHVVDGGAESLGPS